MNHTLMTELLGGAMRYQALRCLYERPDHAFGTRELAAEAGIDPGNASRWLRRWASVGLVDRTLERGTPVFSASRDPALAGLRSLLQQDNEAVQTLRAHLATLKGKVMAAAVFGSAARGDLHATSDLDVLLVATGLSRLAAQAHFKQAGRALGRPVNVLVYSPEEWQGAADNGDTVAQDILSHPLIPLKADIRALA
jgi:predicted nucleotidyltransferase